MAIDITKVWAVDGDKTTIPTDTQPDGSVSFQEGWGTPYQQDPATVPTAKRLSRGTFNYILNVLTTNAKEFVSQGIPNHIVGKTYTTNDMVRGTDGENYISISTLNTDAPPSVKWKIDNQLNINSLTAKTTPIDTDNTIISEADGTLKKLSWENLKATLLTYFSTAFKSLSYKPTLVSITAWNYSSTTITLTVASHTFVAGDTIEVTGLTTTDTGTGATSTYVPNGVWTVSSTTSTTIVFIANVAPTVTNKSVSSATLKGIVLVNGIYGSLGVGQTWQDFTTKRAAGGIYTNTSGKSIEVAITLIASTPGSRSAVKINGVDTIYTPTFATTGHTYPIPIFTVPNGVTYSYPTGTAGNIDKWFELR